MRPIYPLSFKMASANPRCRPRSKSQAPAPPRQGALARV